MADKNLLEAVRMSGLHRRKRGFSSASIIIFFLIVVAVFIAILSSTSGNAAINNYENGFQALESWAGDTGDNLENILRFILFPFLIISLLLYTAIEAGLGHTMKTNIRRVLAVAFAAMTFISPWFITISAALNFYGIPGMIILAILSIVMGAVGDKDFFSFGGRPRLRDSVDRGKELRDRAEELEDLEDTLNDKMDRVEDRIDNLQENLNKEDSSGESSGGDIPGFDRVVDELRDIKGAIEDRESLDELIAVVEEALDQMGSGEEASRNSQSLESLISELNEMSDMQEEVLERQEELRERLEEVEKTQEEALEQAKEDIEDDEAEISDSELPEEVIMRVENLLEQKKSMMNRIDSIFNQMKGYDEAIMGRLNPILSYASDIVNIGEGEEAEGHYRNAGEYYDKADKRYKQLKKAIRKLLSDRSKFADKHEDLIQQIEALQGLADSCVNKMRDIRAIKESGEYEEE